MNDVEIPEDQRRPIVSETLDIMVETTGVPRNRLKRAGLLEHIFLLCHGLDTWREKENWQELVESAQVWIDPSI